MTGRAHTPLGRLTQGGARGLERQRRPMGRVTRLTPELSKRICDAIRAGNYLTVAARYCGVSPTVVHEWIARGRGEHSRMPRAKVYTDFANAVDEAEAGAEVAAVLHWRSAMPKDWHSSEKWLKVRQPERWGEKPPEYGGGNAFAGVQVNIDTGSAKGGGEGRREMEVPLQSLLESNPDLISGTMQFLDQLLPVGGEKQPEAVETNDTTAIQPYKSANPSPESQTEVLDAEPGSWRTVEPE